MKRRDFIYRSLAGLGAFGTVAASGNVYATLKTAKPLVVCFRSGTFETIASNGSWDIAVMADPRRSQAPSLIRLKLEVASDEMFQNVIFEEIHYARKKNSYIVRARYHPPVDEPKLFYRFVAIDTQLGAARGRLASPHPTSEIKRLGS